MGAWLCETMFRAPERVPSARSGRRERSHFAVPCERPSVSPSVGMCRSAQSAPASLAMMVKTRARGQFRGAVMQIVPDPAWLAGPSGRSGDALTNPALLSSLRSGLRGLY